MTFETPKKVTMAPCSGEERDRLSDHTNQPAASPNPKDLQFLGAGINAEKIGSNGKDAIEIQDSPPKTNEMLMDSGGTELTQDDAEKATRVVKLISTGGLDEDVIGDDYDDAKTSVSLLNMFDSAQASKSANKDDYNSNDTHKLANAIMQETDDDDTDMDDNKDYKLTLTSNHKDNNLIIDNKNKETNKNNKNKNKNNDNLDHINDHTENPSNITSTTTTVLSLKTLKTHPSKWTTLSQQAKNLMPYIDTNCNNALMDLDNCLFK
jgi:hypothetical protein